MKRSAAGTFPTYKQKAKRIAKKQAAARSCYTSVARTRGAAVTGEMKYFDADYNPVSGIAVVTTSYPAGSMVDPLTTINLGAAPVANPLTLCAPTVGAGLNQRVGRKINIHKVKIHGTVSIPAQAAQAVADPATKIRIVLVLDQQTNATQMTAAQLFNDGTAAVTVINSFQNPNNFGRFRVLKDKYISFSNMNLAGSPTSADVIQASARINFKFAVNFKKPIVVHFNAANGGTVADIVDNSLHMICATDNNSYAPNIAYYSRVCYKDV